MLLAGTSRAVGSLNAENEDSEPVPNKTQLNTAMHTLFNLFNLWGISSVFFIFSPFFAFFRQMLHL
jgi:hypothetical protein